MRPPRALPPPPASPRTTRVSPQALRCLVGTHGEKNWALIATHLHARNMPRNGKQCRERWRNHLRPALDKSHWTPEEDAYVWERVQAVGSRWAQISEMYMPARTDNDIKNRWNSIIRKSCHPLGRPWSDEENSARAAVLGATWMQRHAAAEMAAAHTAAGLAEDARSAHGEGASCGGMVLTCSEHLGEGWGGRKESVEQPSSKRLRVNGSPARPPPPPRGQPLTPPLRDDQSTTSDSTVAVDEVAPGRVDAAEVESLEKAAVDAMVRAPPAIIPTSTSFLTCAPHPLQLTMFSRPTTMNHQNMMT